jgi:hypothetical protein
MKMHLNSLTAGVKPPQTDLNDSIQLSRRCNVISETVIKAT